MRLQYLGRPKTYRDPDTGSLVTDLDSIHRADALEGDTDLAGYDDFDEFGDDDSDEDFGYDSSDDDDSDDDDSDEEFGASRGRQRRQARRSRRQGRRKSRRSARKSRRSGKGKGGKTPMQKTILSGSATSTAAGAVAISITPSHPFKAEDIVFNGSDTSATVTSIMFGDNLIWNNASGVDQSVFSTSSFIRGLIKGAKAVPGVPITINGTIASANDSLKATLVGWKPGRPC